MAALPDRSQVRADFAALLASQVSGAGHLAQQVYGFSVKDFGAKMPVLVLGSAGTEQKSFTLRGSRPSYLIDLAVFVLYAAVEEDGTIIKDPATGLAVWDEQASEAALDQIETQIRELLDNNQRGPSWKAVAYAAATSVQIVSVGDQTYRVELIPLRFETF